MSSLRVRIGGGLSAVVLLAIGSAAVVHIRSVSTRLEAQLEAQSARAVLALSADLEQSARAMDEELDRLVGSSRGGRPAGAGGRYLWAAERLDPGRLDLLKMLDPGGEILTSGHWPASIGALDPGAERYRGESDRPLFVEEPVPAGSAPSLQRWARGRWGEREVIAVVGRRLDPEAMTEIRGRLAADLLALCPGDGRACAGVTAEGALPDPAILAEGRFLLSPVPLDAAPSPPRLLVGFDRAPIEALARTLRRRALALAGLGSLLALGLGWLLAGTIARPIEALARQAESLAEGDFEARVDARGGGAEVAALVRAFNRAGADLQRNQRRLVQAERVAAWREIARGLAHELKNPLTPIRGAMDVIRRARRLDRPDFDEILDEQAEAVVEEVRRLQELADSFSRFARLPDPAPEALDLRALLEGIAALYVPEGVELRLDLPSPPPPLRADDTQLRTALTNLVKNAVEAMEGHGTLRLSARTDGADVRIEVDDSGPGIADEVADRLFTPYVTTKGSRGTGLGLALAHRIVVEHGGRIEVGRAELGGARFSVRVPASGPPSTDRARPDAPG